MKDREIQFLAFDEDEFDLDSHKKTASAHVQTKVWTERTRRKTAAYKVLIMLLAFVIAYGLYNMVSEVIQRYDYQKYHITEYRD